MQSGRRVSITISVEEEVNEILTDLGGPIEEGAREMIIYGIYRRGRISSAHASALLGMTRLAFFRRMNLSDRMRNPRLIARSLGVVCTVALLGNIHLLRTMQGHYHRGSYILLCSVVGGLLGWTLALLASPTEKEKSEFAGYAKIISGFLTAYLFVKIDPIVTAFINDTTLRTEEVAVR